MSKYTDLNFNDAIQDSLKEACKELGSLTEDNKEQILKRGLEIICDYDFEVMLAYPKQVKIQTVENGKLVEKTIEVTTKTAKFPHFCKSADLLAIYKRLADFSKLPIKSPFVHNANRNKFIKNAKLLFPNVDAYNVGACLTNYRKIIQNIYYNLGYDNLKPQQVSFYQYSALGGTGKSNFLDKLKHFATTYNIPVSAVNPTNQRWIGSEYSSNIVGIVNEFFPPRNNSDRDDKIVTMNNIIDNEDYQVEYKGRDPYYQHSKISLFINSNRIPFDSNIRRYGVVRYNEMPYNRISQEDKEKYFKDRTPEEWDKIILATFESCPFDEDFEDTECKNSDNLNDIIYAANEVIDNIYSVQAICDPQNITIREFAKAYLTITSSDHIVSPEAVKKLVYGWTNDIMKAVAEGVIRPSQRINGNLAYSRYNIQEIADLPTPEDEIDNSLNNINNMFERTSVAFDNFLEPEEPEDPKPTDDNLEFTEEDIKETHMLVCDDKYSQPTTTIKDTTQFIVTAEPTQEYVNSKPATLDRKGEHYRPTCFVYEMDETPIEEQKQIVIKLKERIPENIYSITYSGSKSIHTLVWIKPEDRNEVKTNFKWYWTEVAKELFGTDWEKLDKQDASIARLSRRPGAIRDNGKKQECYYLNRNALGLDISNLIKLKKIEDKHQKEVEDYERRLRELKQQEFKFDNERPLIEQLQSIVNSSHNESGALALEILQSGTAASGSNMIGAIGYMSRLAKNDSKWYDLGQQLVDICHSQHPSNIGGKDFRKFL